MVEIHVSLFFLYFDFTHPDATDLEARGDFWYFLFKLNGVQNANSDPSICLHLKYIGKIFEIRVRSNIICI